MFFNFFWFQCSTSFKICSTPLLKQVNKDKNGTKNFYPEDDDGNVVDFNGATVTFTYYGIDRSITVF